MWFIKYLLLEGLEKVGQVGYKKKRKKKVGGAQFRGKSQF